MEFQTRSGEAIELSLFDQGSIDRDKVKARKVPLCEYLRDGEFYVIDAPGMGSNLMRVLRHVDNGGKLTHKMYKDKDGIMKEVIAEHKDYERQFVEKR